MRWRQTQLALALALAGGLAGCSSEEAWFRDVIESQHFSDYQLEKVGERSYVFVGHLESFCVGTVRAHPKDEGTSYELTYGCTDLPTWPTTSAWVWRGRDTRPGDWKTLKNQ